VVFGLPVLADTFPSVAQPFAYGPMLLSMSWTVWERDFGGSLGPVPGGFGSRLAETRLV
jgi:hypothetical protein